jgi:hypothetical protein
LWSKYDYNTFYMVKYDLYKVKLLLLWLVVGTFGHVQESSWLQYMAQHKQRDPSTISRVTQYRPEHIVPNGQKVPLSTVTTIILLCINHIEPCKECFTIF